MISESSTNGLHHLRSAAAVSAIQHLSGGCQVFLSRRDRSRKKNFGVAGEGNQVKGLFGAQVLQRAADGLLGHLQRKSPHGTGCIEDKNHLPGHSASIHNPVRRLQNKSEVSTGLIGMSQESIPNSLPCDFVFQNE